MKVKIIDAPKNQNKYSKGDIFYSDMIPIRDESSISDIYYRLRTNKGTILVRSSQLEIIGEDDDVIQQTIDSGISAANSINNMEIIDSIKNFKYTKITNNKNNSVNCRIVIFHSLGIPCGWMSIDELKGYFPIKTVNILVFNIESSIFIKKFLDEEKEPYINISIHTDNLEAIYDVNVKVENTENGQSFDFGDCFISDINKALNIKS